MGAWIREGGRKGERKFIIHMLIIGKKNLKKNDLKLDYLLL